MASESSGQPKDRDPEFAPTTETHVVLWDRATGARHPPVPRIVAKEILNQSDGRYSTRRPTADEVEDFNSGDRSAAPSGRADAELRGKLQGMSVAQLETIFSDLGLAAIESGSGKDGGVVKADLVDALMAVPEKVEEHLRED